MTPKAAARDSVTKLLRERLGPVVREQEPMRTHTTLQIGGPADWYVDATTPEMVVKALGAAAEARFEPASVAGLPVAVNVVWILAHTTVRATPGLPSLPGPRRRAA